jgi:integrase/recombinase XerD
MVLVHQFLEMMVAERGATRSTLSSYEADLCNFYSFLKNQSVECVTLQDIQSYLLTQKQLSSATVDRRLSSLRQFYIFLMSRGIIKENPFSLLKPERPKSVHRSFLSEEDVERLLEGTKMWKGPEGKRLFVLLQILYTTDVPVKDLVSFLLTFAQVKNLPVPALEALQEYLKVRNYFFHGKESPWLFPSLSHKGHLTRQRFGQLLKELSLKVGLDSEHISLSKIRYSFTRLKKL